MMQSDISINRILHIAKIFTAIILACVLINAASFTVVFAQENQDFVQDEILVKFSSSVSESAINTTIQSIDGAILNRYKIVDGLVLIKIPENIQVSEAVSALEKSSYVEYASPNYIRYASAIPNDPGYLYLWGLNNTGQTGGLADADIDAQEAWDITTGSPDNVIAVIDSGADIYHEDLAANIWTNPGEIPDNGIDDDGNGYIDDVHGWDFFSNDNETNDPCHHGTHVSGTIGAVGNNGTGVTGINWNVRIIPLKFLGGNPLLCFGSDANAIRAIEYAADKGVRISNNSWGGGDYSVALEDAIRNSNMIFVAAAGNEGNDNDSFPSYPASYSLDNIISVAASDDSDILAYFSNYGVSSVDLSAPGVDILSTIPGDQYDFFSGTSMATPHVTGVAGLLLAENPAFEGWQVIWKILQGTDSKGLPVLSGGRLNAYNSLSLPDPAKIRTEETGLQYRGTWNTFSNPGFSGGNVRYSDEKNSGTGMQFNGTGVMVIASKAPILGTADVYVDRVYKTTVDLYHPSVLHKEVVYSNLSLGSGSHTIAIRVRGEKNPESSNTIVNIDAIDVVN